MIITISHLGYIKRTPLSEFRAQNRGGMGARGSVTRDEDFIEHIYTASMHSYMLFFTRKGRCYRLKVYDLPEGAKSSKGRAIQNLLNIDPDDAVNAFIRVKGLNDPDFVNSPQPRVLHPSGRDQENTPRSLLPPPRQRRQRHHHPRRRPAHIR